MKQNSKLHNEFGIFAKVELVYPGEFYDIHSDLIFKPFNEVQRNCK